MPMASLGGLVGGFTSPDLSIIRPGTMFLMDGNGEHQRYEVGEYNRAVL